MQALITIGLFIAAAIFAVGLWGVFQIIRGFVRELRAHYGEKETTDG
jgi:uncharacterized membrane protein